MTVPNRRWFRWSLRTMFVVVTLFAIAASLYLESVRPIQWREFSPAAVRLENSKGHDVLVSFTADWDISTAMQHRLIDTPSVGRELRINGVIPMRADWSSGDASIRRELASLGLVSIPAVVLYPASGKPPTVLDAYGLLTAEQLMVSLGTR